MAELQHRFWQRRNKVTVQAGRQLAVMFASRINFSLLIIDWVWYTNRRGETKWMEYLD